MKTVVLIAVILGLLTWGVGLVHGTSSQPFAVMAVLAVIVEGWLLVRFALAWIDSRR
jgi:hypothetical protein